MDRRVATRVESQGLGTRALETGRHWSGWLRRRGGAGAGGLEEAAGACGECVGPAGASAAAVRTAHVGSGGGGFGAKPRTGGPRAWVRGGRFSVGYLQS